MGKLWLQGVHELEIGSRPGEAFEKNSGEGEGGGGRQRNQRMPSASLRDGEHLQAFERLIRHPHSHSHPNPQPHSPTLIPNPIPNPQPPTPFPNRHPQPHPHPNTNPQPPTPFPSSQELLPVANPCWASTSRTRCCASTGTPSGDVTPWRRAERRVGRVQVFQREDWNRID